jgi:hypothetical protein
MQPHDGLEDLPLAWREVGVLPLQMSREFDS